MNANCDHYAAAVNLDAGLPCGTIGTPDAVGVYNHPTFSKSKLNGNGGIYAQDSWTIDRLTINYGVRMDFATISVPATPKPLGRFVNSFSYPAAEILPSFGPDWAPRLSIAYDLFGDARTALKSAGTSTSATSASTSPNATRSPPAPPTCATGSTATSTSPARPAQA